MVELEAGAQIRTYALILGGAYITYMLLGVLNTFAIKQGVYEVETFAATAGRFRLAQAVDSTMYCVVISASWASYVVTRAVNKEIALLALLFRFGEGLLGCVAAMVSMMLVILLGETGEWASFESGQLQSLGTMFMHLNNTLWDILFVLMGIGALLFMYLFYIARLVPIWLSIRGGFTYFSMVLYGLAKIVAADLPEQLMLVMFPGALLELAFGCLLLVKRVNLRRLAQVDSSSTSGD